jgi:acetoin utilization deacetylase AcuC-like enzyme
MLTMKTGVVCDRRFMAHSMGSYHVESPARIEVLDQMIRDELHGPFLALEPRSAAPEEICRVHERGYFDFIKSTAGKEAVFLDPDTSAGPSTFETALLAAGGLLRTLDSVMSGEVRNAFALVRPPGHHAEASGAQGFCIFNNVAVGAEYLLRKHGLERILIVDWDLHHGNGTQHSFYPRRDVLYFSTHQAPFYPGTGGVGELGEGEGHGFSLNVPLLPGKGDDDFLFIYQEILAPVAERYRPDFILVSAGFDIGDGDPLGGMRISRQGFGRLADSLGEMARISANGRIAYVLEGGYNLQILKDGVKEVLIRLTNPPPGSQSPGSASPSLRTELEPCFQKFGPLWGLDRG